MQIEIPVRKYGRLARISKTVPATEKRAWLRSVFVERVNGHVYAGATNSMFAAIYRIGRQEGDDGLIVLRSDLDLPHMSDSTITVHDFPLMNWSNLTMPGIADVQNPVIRNMDASDTFRRWRDWIPHETPNSPGRAMFIDCDYLLPLVESSPSRSVVFPKVIDAEKPVFVRDVSDPDWLGVFFARPHSGIFLQGATRPEWSL